jgi:hypothetical protein
MSRTYSDRVMRFRRGVYTKRAGMTNGCRVLLLRLSDAMDAKCIVSVPRSTLAKELGVAPARITEWIAQAKDLGFLSPVRRGRPGVTAVYQGMVVAPEVRQGVPPLEVRPPGHDLVPQGVPQNEVQRYALGGSQVGKADCTSAGSVSGSLPNEKRQLGEAPHESTAQVRDRARHEYDEEASA